MKYDVTVSFDFIGVRADSEEQACELADEAVAAVKVEHPTTKEDIYSTVEALESD